jgi:hypothetical protein
MMAHGGTDRGSLEHDGQGIYCTGNDSDGAKRRGAYSELTQAVKTLRKVTVRGSHGGFSLQVKAYDGVAPQ